MHDLISTLLETVRIPWDLIDIALVALLLYWGMNLIKGTRAMQMLWGMAVLFIAYAVSQYFELMTINWILANFLGSIVIVFVVIFQNDIRKALTQVGKNPFFSGFGPYERTEFYDELVRACTSLSMRRMGALIVIERRTGLKDYIEGGTEIDSKVSREIIQSVFMPGSPLHDGAVIIQNGRIIAAGCVLPLTANPSIPKILGTRHRAAIGLSEEADAVAIVVSEENGAISIALEGKLTRELDGSALRTRLERLLSPSRRIKKSGKRKSANVHAIETAEESQELLTDETGEKPEVPHGPSVNQQNEGS